MTEIPDDVMKSAYDAVHAPTADEYGNSMRYYIGNNQSDMAVRVVARAILAERKRCSKVAVDAHNEWAGDAELWEKDGHHNASKKSIAMAHGAALIAGRINNS